MGSLYNINLNSKDVGCQAEPCQFLSASAFSFSLSSLTHSLSILKKKKKKQLEQLILINYSLAAHPFNIT